MAGLFTFFQGWALSQIPHISRLYSLPDLSFISFFCLFFSFYQNLALTACLTYLSLQRRSAPTSSSFLTILERIYGNREDAYLLRGL